MRIIIFANGSLPNPEIARALIRPDDFIIAADGGTRHALALGLTPNVVLGDFDSMTFDLRLLTEKGTQILKYPADKNETDLELALQHALTLNPDSILILAALGGRTDHTLANIALLTDPRFSALDLRFNDGVEEIFLCRDQARVRGRSGDIVSLIPWGSEVTGIVTSGLKWTLQNETLYPEKTRGISNEMTAHEAAVSIESGLLLIIHRSLTTDR